MTQVSDTEDEQRLFEARVEGARQKGELGVARAIEGLRRGDWDHMIEAIARDPLLFRIVDARREFLQGGEIDRAQHTCHRPHGWSLFSASVCDGCAMSYLRAGGDIVGLARACTGLDGFKEGLPGINYEGAPSERQRSRCKALWCKLHGGE